MATRNSSQTGNWSSSSTWGGAAAPGPGDVAVVNAGHVVTVTADTRVGLAGATGTDAVVVAGGGELVVTGCKLTVDGNIVGSSTYNSGTTRPYLTLNPSGTTQGGIEFDPPSGSRYRLELPIDAILTSNGTASGRCYVRTKSGAAGSNAYIDGPGGFRCGQMDADYTDFTRLGDSGQAAVTGVALNFAGTMFSNDHCVWDTCGDILPTLDADGTFSLVDTSFVNSQGSTYALTIAINAARAGGATTRQMVRCSFDKLVYSSWRGFTLTDNYFRGWSGATTAGWTSFVGGCVNGIVANDAPVAAGSMTDVYVIQDPAGGSDSNPHFISTWLGGDSDLDGLVFEYLGSDDSGDCVTGLGYGAASTLNISIKRCIVLPNAAGLTSGTPFTLPDSADVLLTAEHNTWFIGTQAASVGEPSGTSTAGVLASFKGNLFWNSTLGGYKLYNAGAITSGGTNDIVDPANADYNASFNVNSADPSAYPGNAYPRAGKGYQLGFSAADPGVHDLDGTDPAFVDSTVNLAAWDDSLGGAGTAAAALARLAADPSLCRSSLLPFVWSGMRPTALQYTARYDATRAFPGDATTTDAAGNPLAGTVGAMAYQTPPVDFTGAKATWDDWANGDGSGQTKGPGYIASILAKPAALGNLDGDLHYDAIGVAIDGKLYNGNTDFDADLVVARYQARDQYFWPNGGASVSGYHRFTDGLRKDWERNGEADSRDMAILASYGGYGLPIGSGGYDLTEVWTRSRECALSLLAGINAERLGRAHQARTDELAQYAMSHIDVWVSDPTNATNDCLAVQPFMTGITMYALIAYHDYYAASAVSGVPAIVAAIPGKVKEMLDYLRTYAWFADALAFPYWDRDTDPMHSNGSCEASAYDAYTTGTGLPPQPIPCPLLNSLIGPAYAWYGLTASDPDYVTYYEEAFVGSTMAGRGGDLSAYPDATTVGYDVIAISTQKQWNQSTLFEFKGVKWRDQAVNPWADATAYTLTAPGVTSGQANVPSGRFVVALSGGDVKVDTPVVVTPSDGAAGGRFLPAAVTLTTDEPRAVFRYIPAAVDDGNTVTISVTDSGGLTDPSSVTYTVSGVATLATGYSVTAPATANGTGEYSPDWTVALTPAGSVPPSGADADGGLVLIQFGGLTTGVTSPAYFAWLSAERTSATFQLCPNGASQTIAFVNNCGFSNPSNITYTAGTPSGHDYTLVVPGTGTVGVPAGVKASLTTIDPAASGTVTVTLDDASGGGAFGDSTLELWAKVRAVTTTYTPGSSGSKTVSGTSSLDDPAGQSMTVGGGVAKSPYFYRLLTGVS